MGNGIVVIGSTFVDIKGYPLDNFIPTGRNAGTIEEIHGGVARNIVEDIANLELRPTFISLVDKSGAGLSVLQKLNNHKVNTQYMETRPDGMGTWLVIFGSDGDLFASISKRPNLDPLYDILKAKGDEIFSTAESILIEADLEKNIVKEILFYADKYKLPIFAAVSNMSIALKRRDFLTSFSCFVCNQQEAGLLFLTNTDDYTTEQMEEELKKQVVAGNYPAMVVTMGEKGAVYATNKGESGTVPACSVPVVDTAGAGDAFVSGVCIGMTYGKTIKESCEIGNKLAASVIVTSENVCPRFNPREFGLDIDIPND